MTIANLLDAWKVCGDYDGYIRCNQCDLNDKPDSIAIITMATEVSLAELRAMVEEHIVKQHRIPFTRR